MKKVSMVVLTAVVLAWVAIAYGQASIAPTYTLYADGEYALSVDCVGGEMRLWQVADKQSGILFCEGPTETPTPKAIYTAQPLIGGATTLTPVATEPITQERYYFPLMIGQTNGKNP